jgi:uracil-DNA glycosylase
MTDCPFGCSDVTFQNYMFKTDPKFNEIIKMIMISEAFPANSSDYFTGGESSKFLKNTNHVFGALGYPFSSFEDYLSNGIYLTTALKCTKKDYLVSSKTIENCSYLLEKEIEQFPNVKIIMLMGDFAIKAVNMIWKRKYKERVIPAGSTYKIRGEKFESRGLRFFPSYTQTGDSFGIEKSKVEMIIDDTKKAMELIK